MLSVRNAIRAESTHARAPNYNTRQIFRNNGVGVGSGELGGGGDSYFFETVRDKKKKKKKNKIDTRRRCQWMENLPTKGNTRARVEILLYISQYIRNIYGFLDAAGRGERRCNIPGKNSRVQSGLARMDMEFSHLHHVLCRTAKQYHCAP